MTNPNQIPVPILGEQVPQQQRPEGIILLPSRIGYMRVPGDDPQMIQGLLQQIESVDQRQIWIDIYLSVISSGAMGSLSKEAAIQKADELFEGYINKFRMLPGRPEEEADEETI